MQHMIHPVVYKSIHDNGQSDIGASSVFFVGFLATIK